MDQGAMRWGIGGIHCLVQQALKGVMENTVEADLSRERMRQRMRQRQREKRTEWTEVSEASFWTCSLSVQAGV